MALIVTVVGGVAVLIGLIGAASPGSLIVLVQRLQNPARFWFAVLFRVVLGKLFLIVAPDCRVPLLVQVVRVVSIVAALAILGELSLPGPGRTRQARHGVILLSSKNLHQKSTARSRTSLKKTVWPSGSSISRREISKARLKAWEKAPPLNMALVIRHRYLEISPCFDSVQMSCK